MKWTVTLFVFVGLQAVIFAAPASNELKAESTTIAPTQSTKKVDPTTTSTINPSNETTTVAPNTTTTVSPTKPTTTTPAPTTTSTTTVSPTTAPPSKLTTTPPPSSTTPKGTTTVVPTKPPTTVSPIETTPTPGHQHHFDGLSFMGGIILTVTLLGLSLFSWKFYKFRAERNYRTL